MGLTTHPCRTSAWTMKTRTALMGLIALTLTGCVSPVMLRNPTTGEVTQCLATGAFPLINQHQCVVEYENVGWLRTTAPEAQQAQRLQVAERDAEIKAALEECRNARLSGSLKGYVASVQCSNPRIREANRRAGYQFMDLVDLALAARLADAERQDAGKMSEADSALHMAQVNTQIVEEARRRLLETQAANARTNAVNAQANAANAQAITAQQQIWLQYQKQNDDNLNAAQQRQVDLFRATIRQPRQSFTCRTFGDTTTCN